MITLQFETDADDVRTILMNRLAHCVTPEEAEGYLQALDLRAIETAATQSGDFEEQQIYAYDEIEAQLRRLMTAG